ncbi:MAG TPA: family 78 glycoside hydrolase catalytic domain, partial [Amnibacterium sp.]|nr:family 78 glycoside hydrolase catalytic domain [Amnibacterium sp.]
MPELRPHALRVEHLRSPLGIGAAPPRLSWRLPAGTLEQRGYEIEIELDGQRISTGLVPSRESVLVPGPARASTSRERVGWRVRILTEAGWSAWSERSSWECGLLDPEDWSARWIEPVERERAAAGSRPTHWLRTTFLTPATIARGRLYITAHGVYEAHLNGVRVGDAELTPGYTQYEHRLQVQTLDVTDLLDGGRPNELAVEVSDGWWRGQVGLFRASDQWGATTGLLAQLEMDAADGTRTTVATDGSWTWAPSRHLADLIAGETLDLGHPGPSAPWRPVRVTDDDLSPLVPSPSPPVRRVGTLPAVSIRRAGPRQIVDFGRNSNGWVRLGGLGAAGSRLVLTYGEALDPSGDLTQANIVPDVPMLPQPLPAGQVDTVLVGDEPDAVVEPRHSTKGFRYVAVEGLDHDLDPADVTAVVVHTDLAATGTFACSDLRIDRLHEAARWSFLGNACDIPTDCPTRERAGWSGDWQLFFPSAAFLFDVAGFGTKWLRDFVAGQWPDGVLPNTAPEPRFEGREGPNAFLAGSAGWG